MLPHGIQLFVHVYESKTFKKMVEIKKLVINLIYLNFFNMRDGNMTLVIINWSLIA
jgi:hypothetical protein